MSIQIKVSGSVRTIVGIYTVIGGQVRRLRLQGIVGGAVVDYIKYVQTLKEVMTIGESMVKRRSTSLTVQGLVSVESISVNTGNASYTISGNVITVTVDNGSVVRSVYNSTKYRKAASAYRTSSTNSFSSTYSYSSGGYSGALYKDGGSYVSSGSYTPSDTKTISYKETLSKEQCNYYNAHPSEAAAWQAPHSYSSGGYTGMVYVSLYSTNADGSRTYLWSGTGTRPASDTRVYRQDYYGTVYQGGYDDYYAYIVTITYKKQ